MSTRRLQVCDDTQAPAASTPLPTLRVAIATSDLKALDSHFGSAKRFAIYEVTPSSSRLLEAVSFDAVTEQSGSHLTDGDDRIGPKVAALQGVNLLFVLAIGGPAAAKVVASKIHPVKLKEPEPIDSIIGRVQSLMTGTPPPWLRKAMLGAKSPSLADLDAEDPT